LYARPHDSAEPVICVDEKSKQLLQQTRTPLAARPGAVAKEDYEYQRAGACNLFVAVEPKGHQRMVEVSDRRTKPDFVALVVKLAQQVYAGAKRLHVVLDNLNPHFRSCIEDVLGPAAAATVLARVEFHYPPSRPVG
jgi:hypothetical protein